MDKIGHSRARRSQAAARLTSYRPTAALLLFFFTHSTLSPAVAWAATASTPNNPTTSAAPPSQSDLPTSSAAAVAEGTPSRDALLSGADKSGVTSKAISIPQGSGKIQGMGESFSAQLSTGIATFSVPFALPKARGGAQPSLGLSYSSSGGFG